MTTTVHLLRHGEVFNPHHILYGRLPGYRLSDLGVAQAKVAAEWFAGRPVGHLVSSPLERAQQTAQPLAQLTGLEVHTDHRLIEAANAFEGRSVAHGSSTRNLLGNPAHWRHFRNPLRPSWGEPYEQIAARMFAAAHAARRAVEGSGTEAVCVSHQLPIVCTRRRATGLPLWHDPRRRQCTLASVTSLVFDGDVVVRVDYAEPAAGVLPPGEGTGA